MEITCSGLGERCPDPGQDRQSGWVGGLACQNGSAGFGLGVRLPTSIHLRARAGAGAPGPGRVVAGDDYLLLPDPQGEGGEGGVGQHLHLDRETF